MYERRKPAARLPARLAASAALCGAHVQAALWDGDRALELTLQDGTVVTITAAATARGAGEPAGVRGMLLVHTQPA